MQLLNTNGAPNWHQLFSSISLFCTIFFVPFSLYHFLCTKFRQFQTTNSIFNKTAHCVDLLYTLRIFLGSMTIHVNGSIQIIVTNIVIIVSFRQEIFFEIKKDHPVFLKKKQVPFSLAIGNVELRRSVFPNNGAR